MFQLLTDAVGDRAVNEGSYESNDVDYDPDNNLEEADFEDTVDSYMLKIILSSFPAYFIRKGFRGDKHIPHQPYLQGKEKFIVDETVNTST